MSFIASTLSAVGQALGLTAPAAESKTAQEQTLFADPEGRTIQVYIVGKAASSDDKRFHVGIAGNLLLDGQWDTARCQEAECLTPDVPPSELCLWRTHKLRLGTRTEGVPEQSLEMKVVRTNAASRKTKWWPDGGERTNQRIRLEAQDETGTVIAFIASKDWGDADTGNAASRTTALAGCLLHFLQRAADDDTKQQRMNLLCQVLATADARAQLMETGNQFQASLWSCIEQFRIAHVADATGCLILRAQHFAQGAVPSFFTRSLLPHIPEAALDALLDEYPLMDEQLRTSICNVVSNMMKQLWVESGTNWIPVFLWLVRRTSEESNLRLLAALQAANVRPNAFATDCREHLQSLLATGTIWRVQPKAAFALCELLPSRLANINLLCDIYVSVMTGCVASPDAGAEGIPKLQQLWSSRLSQLLKHASMTCYPGILERTSTVFADCIRRDFRDRLTTPSAARIDDSVIVSTWKAMYASLITEDIARLLVAVPPTLVPPSTLFQCLAHPVAASWGPELAGLWLRTHGKPFMPLLRLFESGMATVITLAATPFTQEACDCLTSTFADMIAAVDPAMFWREVLVCAKDRLLGNAPTALSAAAQTVLLQRFQALTWSYCTSFEQLRQAVGQLLHHGFVRGMDEWVLALAHRWVALATKGAAVLTTATLLQYAHTGFWQFLRSIDPAVMGAPLRDPQGLLATVDRLIIELNASILSGSISVEELTRIQSADNAFITREAREEVGWKCEQLATFSALLDSTEKLVEAVGHRVVAPNIMTDLLSSWQSWRRDNVRNAPIAALDDATIWAHCPISSEQLRDQAAQYQHVANRSIIFDNLWNNTAHGEVCTELREAEHCIEQFAHAVFTQFHDTLRCHLETGLETVSLGTVQSWWGSLARPVLSQDRIASELEVMASYPGNPAFRVRPSAAKLRAPMFMKTYLVISSLLPHLPVIDALQVVPNILMLQRFDELQQSDKLCQHLAGLQQLLHGVQQWLSVGDDSSPATQTTCSQIQQVLAQLSAAGKDVHKSFVQLFAGEAPFWAPVVLALAKHRSVAALLMEQRGRFQFNQLLDNLDDSEGSLDVRVVEAGSYLQQVLSPVLQLSCSVPMFWSGFIRACEPIRGAATQIDERFAQVDAYATELREAVLQIRNRQARTLANLAAIHSNGTISWPVGAAGTGPRRMMVKSLDDRLKLEGEQVDEFVGLAQMHQQALARRAQGGIEGAQDTEVRTKLDIVVPALAQAQRVSFIVNELTLWGHPQRANRVIDGGDCGLGVGWVLHLEHLSQQLDRELKQWLHQLSAARARHYLLSFVPCRSLLLLYQTLCSTQPINNWDPELLDVLRTVSIVTGSVALAPRRTLPWGRTPETNQHNEELLTFLGGWLQDTFYAAYRANVGAYGALSRDFLRTAWPADTQGVVLPATRPLLVELTSSQEAPAMLLSLFTAAGALPSPSEYLTCDAHTTVEDVMLLMNRCWHATAPLPRRAHYVVGIEHLSMPVLEALAGAIRNKLEALGPHASTEQQFHLVLLSCAVRHPFVGATVRQVAGLCTEPMAKLQQPKLAHIIVTELPRLRQLPPHEQSVITVWSEQAGQGKSTHIARNAAAHYPTSDYEIIPVCGTVTMAQLVDRLRSRGLADPAGVAQLVLHLDLAPAESLDLNLMLMELTCTGSLFSAQLRSRAWCAARCVCFLEIANTLGNRFYQELALAQLALGGTTPITGGVPAFTKPDVTSGYHELVGLGCLASLADGSLARRLLAQDTLARGAELADEELTVLLTDRMRDQSLQTISYFLRLISCTMHPLLASPFLIPDWGVVRPQDRQLLVNGVIELAARFVSPPRSTTTTTSALLTEDLAQAQAQALVHHVAETMQNWHSHVLLMFHSPPGVLQLPHDLPLSMLAPCGTGEGAFHPVYSRLEDIPPALGHAIGSLAQAGIADALEEPSRWETHKLSQWLATICGQESVPDLGNYALTADNFVKMCLILERVRSGLPVVLMGESGCGKTELLTQLAKFANVQGFHVLAIDAGTEESMFADWLMRHNQTAQELLDITTGIIDGTVANYAATCDEDPASVMARGEELLRRFAPSVWVFLDEINTSPLLPVFKEVICDRRLYGRRLAPNLRILAACNPYRLRDSSRGFHGAGLTVKDVRASVVEEISSRLVYRVLPLPESLLQCIFNFGTIDPAEETTYMRAMVTQGLEHVRGFSDEVKRQLVPALQASHQFIRDVDPNTPVSLRDVARFILLLRWFRGHVMQELDRSLWSRLGSVVGYSTSLSAELTAVILAFCHVYQMRLDNTDTRKHYARTLGECFRIAEGAVLRAVKDEQDAYLAAMELEKDVARNRALRENVFMMLVCIVNRIPIFVTGKPGCSKTLAMNLVLRHLKGSRKEPFFQRLPAATVIAYQGSRQSTAEGIRRVFHRAIDYQKRQRATAGGQDPAMLPVAVVLLDEVGLAEISPHNPCKVLHALLQPTEDSDRVAVVGISNWRLDNAKMNRACHLSCLPASLKDLQDTAHRIAAAELSGSAAPQAKMNALAEKFHEYLQLRDAAGVSEEFPAHGLREFYSFVKFVARTHASRPSWGHTVAEGLLRNFGGLSHAWCAAGPYPRAVAELLHLFLGSDASVAEAMSSLQADAQGVLQAYLIRQNVSDSAARHLMLISPSVEETLAVLENINVLQDRHDDVGGPLILLGSDFIDDEDNDAYNTRMLNRIVAAMGTGQPVVMWNLDALHEALMDMLNQRYEKPHVDGLPMCRVALGGMAKPPCPVDPRFRFVLIVDEDRVRHVPAPLATRFEKQTSFYSDHLSDELMAVVLQLVDWVQHLQQGQPGVSFCCLPCPASQESLIGAVASVVLSCASSASGNRDAAAMVAACQARLAHTMTLEFAVGIRHQEPALWTLYWHEQHHQSLCAYMQFLQELPHEEHSCRDMIGARSIVYTFSGLSSCTVVRPQLAAMLEVQLTDVVVVTLASVRSEAALLEQLAAFWAHESATALLVVCDPNDLNGVDTLQRITLAKIRIDESRARASADATISCPKTVVMLIQLRRADNGAVLGLGQNRYIPVTSCWHQCMLDRIESGALYGIPQTSLLEHSVRDLLVVSGATDDGAVETKHAEDGGEASPSSSPFGQLLRSVAVRLLSRLRFEHGDRPLQEHSMDLEAAMSQAQFIQFLADHTLDALSRAAPDAGAADWQDAVCRQSRMLTLSSSYQYALVEWLKDRICDVSLRMIWLLESHGALSCFREPAWDATRWSIWCRMSQALCSDTASCAVDTTAAIRASPSLGFPYSAHLYSVLCTALRAVTAAGSIQDVVGLADALWTCALMDAHWQPILEAATHNQLQQLSWDTMMLIVKEHWDTLAGSGELPQGSELTVAGRLLSILLPGYWPAAERGEVTPASCVAIVSLHNRTLQAAISLIFNCQHFVALDKLSDVCSSAFELLDLMDTLVGTYTAALCEYLLDGNISAHEWLVDCGHCVSLMMRLVLVHMAEHPSHADDSAVTGIPIGALDGFSGSTSAMPARYRQVICHIARLRLMMRRVEVSRKLPHWSASDDEVLKFLRGRLDLFSASFCSDLTQVTLDTSVSVSQVTLVNEVLAYWVAQDCTATRVRGLVQQVPFLHSQPSSSLTTLPSIVVKVLLANLLEELSDEEIREVGASSTAWQAGLRRSTVLRDWHVAVAESAARGELSRSDNILETMVVEVLHDQLKVCQWPTEAQVMGLVACIRDVAAPILRRWMALAALREFVQRSAAVLLACNRGETAALAPAFNGLRALDAVWDDLVLAQLHAREPSVLGSALMYLLKLMRHDLGEQGLAVYCQKVAASGAVTPRYPVACLGKLKFATNVTCKLGYDPFVSPYATSPTFFSQLCAKFIDQAALYQLLADAERAATVPQQQVQLKLAAWYMMISNCYLARTGDEWNDVQAGYVQLLCDNQQLWALPVFQGPVGLALRFFCRNNSPADSMFNLSQNTSIPHLQTVSVVVHALGLALAASGACWLSDLVLNAAGCAQRYLPCMPDSDAAEAQRALQVAMAGRGITSTWTCRCGEIYFVGECGQPMETSHCPTCRSAIGGASHQPVAGVQQVNAAAQVRQVAAEPGYHFQAVDATASTTRTVRGLTPATYRVIRAVMHAALVGALESRTADVSGLLGRVPRGTTALPELLASELAALPTITGAGTDDVCIGLHCVLHRWCDAAFGMSQTGQLVPGLGTSPLTSEAARQQWEHTFAQAVGNAVFGGLPQSVTAFRRAVQAASAESGTTMRQESINDMLSGEWSCPSDLTGEWLPQVFCVRPSVHLRTFQDIQHLFATEPESARKRHPFLHVLLNDVVQADLARVANLYPILGWLRLVQQTASAQDKLDCMHLTVQQWIERHGNASSLHASFVAFQEAWNQARTLVERYECQDWLVPIMSADMPLAYSLPRRDGNQRDRAEVPPGGFPPSREMPEFVMNPGRHILLILAAMNGLLPEHNRLLRLLQDSAGQSAVGWMSGFTCRQTVQRAGMEEAKHEASSQMPANTVLTKNLPPELVSQSELLNVDHRSVVEVVQRYVQPDVIESKGAHVDWGRVEEVLMESVLSGKAFVYHAVKETQFAGDTRTFSVLEELRTRVLQVPLSDTQRNAIVSVLHRDPEHPQRVWLATETLIRIVIQAGGDPTMTLGRFVRFTENLQHSDLHVFCEPEEQSDAFGLHALQLQHIAGLFEVVEDEIADRLMARVLPQFQTVIEHWDDGLEDLMKATALSLWSGEEPAQVTQREQLFVALRRFLVRYLSSTEHGGAYDASAPLMEQLLVVYDVLLDLPEDSDFELSSDLLISDLKLEHAVGVYQEHARLRSEHLHRQQVAAAVAGATTRVPRAGAVRASGRTRLF